MYLGKSGIHVVIPNEDQVELVNDIIYNELCLGVISNESKQQYLDIIGDLVKSGCTRCYLRLHWNWATY